MRLPSRMLLVCALVLLGAQLTLGQSVDCANLLRSSPGLQLSQLQPCLSDGTQPMVLDVPKRFAASIGGSRQVLDLAYGTATLLLLTPGATIEVANANITGVRLATPSALALKLLAISVQPGASLQLTDVTLETDCATMYFYQQWQATARPAAVSLTPSGDLFVSSWQQSGVTCTSCTLTCRRPPAVALGTASPATTAVSVSTDLEFFNALSLASAVQNGSDGSTTGLYGAGPVTIVVRQDLVLSSPLWPALGVALQRNVTVVGAAAGVPLAAVVSPTGGNATSVGRRVLVDLQELIAAVHVVDGAVLTIQNLMLSNVGIVAGYAPVPFTGLGLVSCFLWFFDVKRSLAPKPPDQLVVVDVDVVVYPEDLDHMSLWATFVTTTAGPLAVLAAPFRIGISRIEIQAPSTVVPVLTFTHMHAYGMDFHNVSLRSDVMAGLTLTARRTGVPLYALNTPLNTTVVPVWTQSDLQGALAGVSRLPACSRLSNTTVYFHIFTNFTVETSKWPAAGFNISCNITLSGTPGRPGSTWFNFNMLPRFVTMSSGAFLTLRSLTLFNMPSSQRTYDLGDLTQMTAPLWPVGRPMAPPASSRFLILQDATVALPLEEYRSLAAVLGQPGGRVPSPAFNASLRSVQVISSTPSSMLLDRMEAMGLMANNTVLTDTSGATPFPALLSATLYGTANMAPPLPASPNTGGGGSSNAGGLSSSAIIAIAVAVPVGAAVLAAAAVVAAYTMLRRSRRYRRTTAAPLSKDEEEEDMSPESPDALDAAEAEAEAVAALQKAMGGGGGSAGGWGGSGNTPASDRSGDEGTGTHANSDTSGLKKPALPALSQSKSVDGCGTAAGSNVNGAAGSGATGGNTAGEGTAGGAAAGIGSNGARNGTSGSGEHTSRESDAPSQQPLHVELHQLILDFAREIEDQHLTIHGPLGSGGFATVYRGTWRGIDVAVKVIEFKDRLAANSDERMRTRAMTEAAIAANIQHTNVVTTYSYDIRPVQPNQQDAGSALLGIGPGPEGGSLYDGGLGSSTHGGTGSRRGSASGSRRGSYNGTGATAPQMWKLYLIQEFCEVGSLRVALENHMLQAPDGQPNLSLILRLSLDVVRGLMHLHKKNIVHGDLTPGNILLKADLTRPGRYIAKLADFGLSVKMDPEQHSVDNNRTGTPFYASPEVRQHGNLTKASDLYAFGVCLWEMYHGRPCYQRVRGVKHYVHATGYPSFPPSAPPQLADLAARCMRRPLEERPQLIEAHEVLRQLLIAISNGLNSGGSYSYAPSETGYATSGNPSMEWPFVAASQAVTGVDNNPYAGALGPPAPGLGMGPPAAMAGGYPMAPVMAPGGGGGAHGTPSRGNSTRSLMGGAGPQGPGPYVALPAELAGAPPHMYAAPPPPPPWGVPGGMQPVSPSGHLAAGGVAVPPGLMGGGLPGNGVIYSPGGRSRLQHQSGGSMQSQQQPQQQVQMAAFGAQQQPQYQSRPLSPPEQAYVPSPQLQQQVSDTAMLPMPGHLIQQQQQQQQHLAAMLAQQQVQAQVQLHTGTGSVGGPASYGSYTGGGAPAGPGAPLTRTSHNSNASSYASATPVNYRNPQPPPLQPLQPLQPLPQAPPPARQPVPLLQMLQQQGAEGSSPATARAVPLGLTSNSQVLPPEVGNGASGGGAAGGELSLHMASNGEHDSFYSAGAGSTAGNTAASSARISGVHARQ